MPAAKYVLRRHRTWLASDASSFCTGSDSKYLPSHSDIPACPLQRSHFRGSCKLTLRSAQYWSLADITHGKTSRAQGDETGSLEIHSE